jgi:hypothetical protein
VRGEGQERERVEEKRRGEECMIEITQTLYAYMNKQKIKRKDQCDSLNSSNTSKAERRHKLMSGMQKRRHCYKP